MIYIEIAAIIVGVFSRTVSISPEACITFLLTVELESLSRVAEIRKIRHLGSFASDLPRLYRRQRHRSLM